MGHGTDRAPLSAVPVASEVPVTGSVSQEVGARVARAGQCSWGKWGSGTAAGVDARACVWVWL